MLLLFACLINVVVAENPKNSFVTSTALFSDQTCLLHSISLVRLSLITLRLSFKHFVKQTGSGGIDPACLNAHSILSMRYMAQPVLFGSSPVHFCLVQSWPVLNPLHRHNWKPVYCQIFLFSILFAAVD